ncbi:MAG: ABC transporter substrate-binding protein [Butyricicoccaceae bacterium]
MKKTVRWAAGLLAAIMLAGCGAAQQGSGTSAQEQTEAAERTTGPIGMAYEESAGLDPITCTSSENRAIIDLCFEGLFELDSSFSAHPALCDSYEMVGEREYRFLLREDAKFHSGEPVTAKDVEYCLDRARQESDSVYYEQLDCISSVEAEDDHTVIIRLRESNTGLPLLLNVPIFRAESEEDSMLADGTGPFMAGKDGSLTLQAFSGWLGGSVSYCSEVKLVEMSSEELTMGGDVTLTLRSNPESDEISGTKAVQTVPTTVMQYFGYNCDLAPLDNADVRRGMSLLLDRDAIVQACYQDNADAAALPVNFEVKGVEASTAADQNAALEALKEGGVYDRDDDGMLDYLDENGKQYQFTVEIIYNENYKAKATMAQLYAQALTEVGIKAEAKGQSYDQCREDLMNESYQVYLGELDVHATFDLSSLLSNGGERNYSGYSNTDMEAQISRLKASEPDQYEENLKAYLETFQAEMPIAPVLFKRSQMVFADGLPKGLDPWPTDLFHGMNKWGSDSSKKSGE